MRWPRGTRFAVWQPVVAVVLAAALSVVTNLVTSSPAVWLVVFFGVFVAGQVGLAVWDGRRAVAAARQARGQVLGVLRPPRPAGPRPAGAVTRAAEAAGAAEAAVQPLELLTATYCPTQL